LQFSVYNFIANEILGHSPSLKEKIKKEKEKIKIFF